MDIHVLACFDMIEIIIRPHYNIIMVDLWCNILIVTYKCKDLGHVHQREIIYSVYPPARTMDTPPLPLHRPPTLCDSVYSILKRIHSGKSLVIQRRKTVLKMPFYI